MHLRLVVVVLAIAALLAHTNATDNRTATNCTCMSKADLDRAIDARLCHWRSVIADELSKHLDDINPRPGRSLLSAVLQDAAETIEAVTRVAAKAINAATATLPV